MIPSTLFAFAAILSSFAAVSGGVVQRDGTFTYLSPQPTAAQSVSTTGTTSATGTPSTTGTTSTTGTLSTTGTPSTTGTTTSPLSFNVTSARSTTPTGTSTGVTNGTSPTTASATTTSSFSFISFGSSTPLGSSLPFGSSSPFGSSIPRSTTSQTLSSMPMPSGTGTANCNGVQQWQASLAYNGGDKVIYNNQLFTAKQWTYDNVPATHPDQWTTSGTCTQPINNQASCTGVAAWQSTVAYTTGSRVTYNNHLWSAVQWTQSNTPGDTSGLWKDQGACA